MFNILYGNVSIGKALIVYYLNLNLQLGRNMNFSQNECFRFLGFVI